MQCIATTAAQNHVWDDKKKEDILGTAKKKKKLAHQCGCFFGFYKNINKKKVVLDILVFRKFFWYMSGIAFAAGKNNSQPTEVQLQVYLLCSRQPNSQQ